jgi:predicted small secreted protein
MRPVRTRSFRLLTAALVAGCLVLAGCGGGDDGEGSDAPAAEAAPSNSETAGDPDTWPLTGEVVDSGESSEQKHPVLVLKMDNTSSSAPQEGLGSADLVVEELVEGGMTRLAAFYYSDIPGEVGPVRSMRASDIGIVSPVGGSMVTSGAANVTLQRVKDAGIDFYTEGSAGFFRKSDRSAPYNLFTDMGKVAKNAQHTKTRPDDYLPWGTEGDLPKGQPAKHLAASFSGGHTTSWVFRNGGYVNENSYAADGDEFPADTVLVLRVPVGDAGYTDPAGNPVPETKFEGSGDAMIFHDGRLVRGSWKKKGLDKAVTLSTKKGDLTVPAGRVWIELVPQNGGNVTFGK